MRIKYNVLSVSLVTLSLVLPLSARSSKAAVVDDVLVVVEDVQSSAASLLTRTSGIKTRTEATLAEAQYIAQSARDGLVALPAEVVDAARYGLADLQGVLSFNREGLASFLGVPEAAPVPVQGGVFDFGRPTAAVEECAGASPCALFREDLVLLLEQLETVANKSVAASELGVQVTVDTATLRSAIDVIPGRALYPLYRAVGADLNLLFSLLQEAEEVLDVFEAFVDDEYGNPTQDDFADTHFESLRCPLIIDRYGEVSAATQVALVTSRALKLSGKTLMATGETYLKMVDISGGYAGGPDVEVEVSSNMQASLGSFLDGLSDSLANRTESVDSLIAECAGLSAQLKILAQQERILSKLGIEVEVGPEESGDGDGGCSVGSTGATPPYSWLVLGLLFAWGRRRRA